MLSVIWVLIVEVLLLLIQTRRNSNSGRPASLKVLMPEGGSNKLPRLTLA